MSTIYLYIYIYSNTIVYNDRATSTYCDIRLGQRGTFVFTYSRLNIRTRHVLLTQCRLKMSFDSAWHKLSMVLYICHFEHQ